MMMKRLACATACVLFLGVLLADRRATGTAVAQSDSHSYFAALIARSDFLKGWSLRPKAGVTNPADPYYEKQLNNGNSGGFHAYGSCPPSITYSPQTDTDPHAQDAARSPIKAFEEPGVCQGHPLTQPMSARTSGANDIVHLTAVTSTYGPPGHRQVQIDDELLDIRPCTVAEGGDNIRGHIAAAGKLCVKRGMHGTTAVAHSVGIKPKVSTNQINNFIRVPIGTLDGNTYLVTWDTYWTDSYLGLGTWNTGQKTFQFTDAQDNKLFEPKLQYDGGNLPGGFPIVIGRDVGAVTARAYNEVWNGAVSDWSLSNGNMMGPGFTANNPVAPIARHFVIAPNRWTRWWVLIDQRASDWDLWSLWVADEQTNPVLIYDRIPLSIERKNPQAQPSSVRSFWFEQGDSSTAWRRGDLRDLVSYLRNFAVLRNPADVPGLLLRPGAGAALTQLAPPRNLRILSNH